MQSTSAEVPFPKYLIALVQDESEMLLQPAYDLFAFLDDQADQRWDVELYTERTFEALLRAEAQFDCIVIGLNAAYKSKLVRDALAARLPRTGLCVLHQFEQGSVPFLVEDLGLDVTTFKQPAAPVLTAEKLPVADEILLNWPARIELAPVAESDTEPDRSHATGGDEPVQRLIGGEAFTGLVRGSTSSWRTVLEVDAAGRRLPVLVRTPSDPAKPAVVVCSVLLRPREPGHMDLLGNIVSYCVAGRPEALVVGDDKTSDEAQLVHRKLRMQGIKAVSSHVRDGSPLDFERWPYRGISDVVLPEDLDPTAKGDWPRSDPAHARPWLQGGGRISRLGPRERLTVTHRESDAHWVTRNWASWFLSEPAAVWHGGLAHGEPRKGSLISTRAVLRFLAAVHGGAGNERRRQPGLIAADQVLETLREQGGAIDPGRFGLDPPECYLEAVTTMLREYADESSPVAGTSARRFGPPARHLHYSVSTTCALLDVNALMAGKPLDAKTVEPFERWLKTCQFPNAALDDKLEIARCLGDEGLLGSALQSLSQQLESTTHPLTAALVTKLREAIVACDLKADAVPTTSPDPASVVERALRTSPLLCANYLVALGDLRAHWGTDAEREDSLATPDPRLVDRAVIGIGRHGSLVKADDGDGADSEARHEMRSTKALALLAYFGRHPVPTHVIRPEGTGLPPDLVASVLQESEQLRNENAIVLAQTRTLERARHLLAGLVLAVVALAVALLWTTVGPELEIPLAGKLTLTALFALLYPGATLLLKRWDLAARWGRGLARIVAGGVAGLKDRVARGLEEGDVPPSGPR